MHEAVNSLSFQLHSRVTAMAVGPGVGELVAVAVGVGLGVGVAGGLTVTLRVRLEEPAGPLTVSSTRYWPGALYG